MSVSESTRYVYTLCLHCILSTFPLDALSLAGTNLGYTLFPLMVSNSHFMSLMTTMYVASLHHGTLDVRNVY